MNLHKLTAAVVPAVVAVAIGASTAHADAGASEVRYEARLVGNVVETTLDGGFFQVAGDQQSVAVKDIAGNTLVTLPLSFRMDGLEYPLPYQVRDAGRVLDLTAVKNVAAARPAAVVPVASLEENQRAMETFATQFGIATAIGGFIGTAIGAVIGGLVAAPSGVGIPAGIVVGAAIGGIIGTVVAGGPTLLIAGIDLINTLIAPPGTTKWMDNTGR
ncbi:ammonium transporter [Nocardia sp. CDC159]|uniref:Ammonium transporter n=1 Tax=Nocardia pulmonis TaxID=2951408 RepID=A0A9X2E4S8_9NOCA|nr:MULTISPECIES: ammonium transporter [Nocardia]MCM6773073.1 ammonium transporter [Nocardia pulmonis]MCM6785624.1 ammonium transporter [Nocardia sp. CDC159]